jgi:hypothetical protein
MRVKIAPEQNACYFRPCYEIYRLWLLLTGHSRHGSQTQNIWPLYDYRILLGEVWRDVRYCSSQVPRKVG